MNEAPEHIVVLTGAGISAESGISTFRDEGGLWAAHAIEDVATPEAFARNPDLVQAFYNDRRAQLQTVQPNAAHKALADIETAYVAAGRTCTLITQNVDDLHARGGSRHPIHMHGELNKIRCTHCGQISPWQGACDADSSCPHCGAKALRPHIVWFGEMPLYMDAIDAALRDADLFISIGTSGHVYPAAGFVALVREIGTAHTLEINLEASEQHSYFAETRHGRAGELVPLLADELINLLP